MNLLGLDTSSENISFAIMQAGRIAVDFNKRITFGASRAVAYLARALKTVPLSLEGIDALVLGRGPGSFTGLRVSSSVIKAMSLSLSKPVISIGSFFSLAYPFIKNKERIAVVTDARRNLIYAASFRGGQNGLRIEGRERLSSLESFIKTKKNYFFLTYSRNLISKAEDFCPQIDFYPRSVYPKAKNLLLLAQEYYLKKKFTPLDRLAPLYLYPKTCQIVKGYVKR